MSSTRVHRFLRAPRAAVYRALVDPSSIAQWKVPKRMMARVHEFDAREGGAFRVSLSYDDPAAIGKTTAGTDTYHGRFETLVPDEKVVERIEFETDDPALRGWMRVTTTLADGVGGTDLVALHEDLPPGVSPAANEAGWREALENLAVLVEGGMPRPEVRHIGIAIARRPADVYAFVSDPRNLPLWAAGLARSEVRQEGDEWIADAPFGRVAIRFAPPNPFGVLDHDVRLDTGVTVHNPMRVVPAGDGSEFVFTLVRRPEMTDDAFAADAAAVRNDLQSLRDLLERSRG